MYIYTDSSRARVCVCVFFYASSSAIIIEKEAFGKKKGCLCSGTCRFVSSFACPISHQHRATFFFVFVGTSEFASTREKYNKGRFFPGNTK